MCCFHDQAAMIFQAIMLNSDGYHLTPLFWDHGWFIWLIISTIYWKYRLCSHDDVIKWKHFPRYKPFVRGIHRWPVNSPHKGQWPGALMFSLICVWISAWANNREADDLGRHRVYYDVIVMSPTNAHIGALTAKSTCLNSLSCVFPI